VGLGPRTSSVRVTKRLRYTCPPHRNKKRPNEDKLILWFGAPDPRGGPNLFNYLSDEERVRAAKFRVEADRWAFAAAQYGATNWVRTARQSG
jgi:hypothetical protein